MIYIDHIHYLQRTKQKPPITKKLSCVSANDSQKLQLSKTQQTGRIRRTYSALEEVHGAKNSTEKEMYTAAKDGLWVSLMARCSIKELFDYVKKSKKMMTIVQNLNSKSKSCSFSDQIEKSLKILYLRGQCSREKYNSIRRNSLNSFPMLLPYKTLQIQINREHVSNLSVIPETQFNGCSRNLEQLLIHLSNIYLKLNDCHPGFLTWLEKENTFNVCFGADGAPFGQNSSGTSFVISFANVTHRVASNKHNFLVFGGCCAEDSPHFLNKCKQVAKEMEEIEQKSYDMHDRTITFSFDLLTSDQKWVATVSGELNNASMFPSSFANVTKKNMGILNGEVGKQWKPWSYKQRISVATAVAKFKSKTPPKSRSSVTQFIGKLGSRQEFMPYIGKYAEKAIVEPLHMSNLAWQHWHKLLMTLVLGLSPFTKSISAQSEDSALSVYLLFLKRTMKLGKLHSKIVTWYNESCSDLQIRLTGKDSKAFCWHYAALLERLLTGNPKFDFQIYVLHYIANKLSKAASLFSRIQTCKEELVSLEKLCNSYFVANCLFVRESLTVWTIGKVLPYHAKLIFDKWGVGLGINTMQGREAKHQQIIKYLSHSPALEGSLKWSYVMKHEFAELMWLPTLDHGIDTYRRRSTTKSVPKSEMILPPRNSNTCINCVAPSVSGQKCVICSSTMYSWVEKSCDLKKVVTEVCQKKFVFNVLSLQIAKK